MIETNKVKRSAKPKGKKKPLLPPSEVDIEEFKQDFQRVHGFPADEHDVAWWKFFRDKPLVQQSPTPRPQLRKQDQKLEGPAPSLPRGYQGKAKRLRKKAQPQMSNNPDKQLDSQSKLGPSASLLRRVRQYWKENLPKAYAELKPQALEKLVEAADEQRALLISNNGLSVSGANELIYPLLFPEPEDDGPRDEDGAYI